MCLFLIEIRFESASLVTSQTVTPVTQSGESVEQSSARLISMPQAQSRQQTSQSSASGLSMLLASPLDTPVMPSSAMLRYVNKRTNIKTCYNVELWQ